MCFLIMEAKYYSKKGNGIRCNLCPHSCSIQDGRFGICKARQNQGGVLNALGYGVISSSGLDPMEKKPLYHFHPGSRIFSIGSYGCNLHCDFCQNFEISQSFPVSMPPLRSYQPSEVVEKARVLPENIGIAYTYNEPTISFEFMLETARLAKSKGLLNVAVSNGYINPAPLRELLEVLDAFNIDLKSFSDDFYRSQTGGRLKPVLKTLVTIRELGKHLEIAFLVIPGLNDSLAETKAMVSWIASNLGSNTVLHINRYYPAYKLKIPPTPEERLVELYEIAREKLAYVYLGNLHGNEVGCNTICPSCSSTVIRRNGYHTVISALTREGRCSSCGYGPIVVM